MPINMTADDALNAIKEILYPQGDPDSEWSSDELPMVADVVNAYFSTDKPHEKFPCYCEHSQHAPDKWCHESAEFGAVSDYVGNVCPKCARECVPDYIIWPVALFDGRMVYTVDEEHLRMLREANPDVHFGALPAWDSNLYVVATSDQVAKARSGWETYKAERKRLGI